MLEEKKCLLTSFYFNLKVDTSSAQMQAALDQVRGLQTQIPNILDIQVGKNLGESPQGYTYGIVIRFEDTDAFDAFLLHPAHVDAATALNPLCENFTQFDLAQ